jgi:hypothetical protein
MQEAAKHLRGKAVALREDAARSDEWAALNESRVAKERDAATSLRARADEFDRAADVLDPPIPTAGPVAEDARPIGVGGAAPMGTPPEALPPVAAEAAANGLGDPNAAA